jgi:hypothetical protein
VTDLARVARGDPHLVGAFRLAQREPERGRAHRERRSAAGLHHDELIAGRGVDPDELARRLVDDEDDSEVCHDDAGRLGEQVGSARTW